MSVQDLFEIGPIEISLDPPLERVCAFPVILTQKEVDPEIPYSSFLADFLT